MAEYFDTPLPDNSVARITANIAASKMAQWLDLSVTLKKTQLIYKLTFNDAHIGNPIIRAMHGGVISSFLESSARLQTLAFLPDDAKLRTTSVHTNYLHSANDQDMFAAVTIRKLGRRFAFVDCKGWQESEELIIARSSVGVRIIRVEERT